MFSNKSLLSLWLPAKTGWKERVAMADWIFVVLVMWVWDWCNPSAGPFLQNVWLPLVGGLWWGSTPVLRDTAILSHHNQASTILRHWAVIAKESKGFIILFNCFPYLLTILNFFLWAEVLTTQKLTVPMQWVASPATPHTSEDFCQAHPLNFWLFSVDISIHHGKTLHNSSFFQKDPHRCGRKENKTPTHNKRA